MLVRLVDAKIIGFSPIEQIRDCFRGLIAAKAWPSDIRDSEFILAEVTVVVDGEDFVEIMSQFNVSLYVGTMKEVPDHVSRGFLDKWESDWFIVLNHKVDAEINYCIVPTKDFHNQILH